MSRLIVVENWLPDIAFATQAEAVSSSRGAQIQVGYYGRIEREKGIFDYLEAVAIAHSVDARIVGVIYGDGGCLELMNSWLVERGAASFIRYGGWLSPDEKRRALRGLDVFLFPSHAEGYPNALLEVVALKVPIVAVRVGSVPDIIKDGVSGMLAEIGDVEALANAIMSIAHDESCRSRLAERAYARAVASNNYENAVRTVEGLLV